MMKKGAFTAISALCVGAFTCAALPFAGIGQALDLKPADSALADSALADMASLTEPTAPSSTLVSRLVSAKFEQPLPARRDAAYLETLLPQTRPASTKTAQILAEKQCLAEAVYYEARSETRSGQKAVAEVVMNRVASKHFPSSICDVVYQGSKRKTGCQFSFTCDGSMKAAPHGKAWRRAQDVAAITLSGGIAPLTNRATHYHTTEVDPKWSDTMRMTRRVGSHVFYKFAPYNYRASEPAVLAPPPS